MSRRKKFDASKRFGEDTKVKGGLLFGEGKTRQDPVGQAILKMGPKPRQLGPKPRQLDPTKKPDGFGMDHNKPIRLDEKFLIPPFTIFDARQGYWQGRKRTWLNLGIQSEIGRGEDLIYNQDQIDTWRKKNPGKKFPDTDRDKLRLMGEGVKKISPGQTPRPDIDIFTKKKTHDFKARPQGAIKDIDHYRHKEGTRGTKHRIQGVSGTLGKSFTSIHPYDGYDQKEGTVSTSGTSIFDPVLCELIYRWFCPDDGHVLDPFAGGSVRGITAAVLGRNYTGVELSAKQVQANIPQWEYLKSTKYPDHPSPTWIVGDSVHIQDLAPGEYDLVFTCPPYGDLEVYSDDPADISNMKWDDFLDAYYQIIAESCKMLKNNRFACIVIGDFRNKSDGFYRTFPTNTIEAFEEAGLQLLNEGILITAIGSLPIRAGRQFSIARKLGKAHQNVLIFYKGHPGSIKDIFPNNIFPEEMRGGQGNDISGGPEERT